MDSTDWNRTAERLKRQKNTMEKQRLKEMLVGLGVNSLVGGAAIFQFLKFPLSFGEETKLNRASTPHPTSLNRMNREKIIGTGKPSIYRLLVFIRSNENITFFPQLFFPFSLFLFNSRVLIHECLARTEWSPLRSHEWFKGISNFRFETLDYE